MRTFADMTRLLTFICAASLVAAAGTASQAPSPAPAKPPAEAPAPAAAYAYDPAGRRDPFVSLLGRGSDARPVGARPSGVPGLLIGEVSVKGIVKDQSGYMALIQGPDNRTYTVRAGDRLLDGSVKSVVGDAVVFSQDVNDPLSLVKQREIRKTLRSESRG